MKRLTRLAGGLAVAGMLWSAAPAASIARPHLPNNSLVPGRSIGGVRLGEKAGAAIRAWGLAQDCVDLQSGECDIPMKDGADVSFIYLEGRVTGLVIGAGYNGSAYVFPAALARIKTARGIHLGSSTADIAAAYPSAERLGPTHWFIDGPGEACTLFDGFTRVVGIMVLDGKHKIGGQNLCSVARRDLQQVSGQPSQTRLVVPHFAVEGSPDSDPW